MSPADEDDPPAPRTDDPVCREMLRLLSLRADGRVTDAERAALDAHIVSGPHVSGADACPLCSRSAAADAAVAAHLRRRATGVLPRDFTARVLAGIAAAADGEALRQAARNRFLRVAAAAAVVVAAISGTVLLTAGPDAPTRSPTGTGDELAHLDPAAVRAAARLHVLRPGVVRDRSGQGR